MKKGKRLLLLLLSALMITTITPTANSANQVGLRKRVVGYFPSYRYSSAFNSVDYSAMSHVILSFIRYKDKLICDFSDSQIKAIKEKCEKSGSKLMIALGGWEGFSYTDNPIDTEEERTEFINELMYYVDTYDLDGIDIDIEITNEDFWICFDDFASELSNRLKAEKKLLTMAVSPWFTDGIKESTYDYFDFLNLMSYYPINQINNYVLYYRTRGVSDERMNIGVPFYGEDDNGKSYIYSDIIASNKAELSQSNYGNGISYDGIPSIIAKAEYSLSFGGIMVWEVGQDDFEPEYSLLQAIKNVYSVSESEVSPVTNLTSGNTTFTGTKLNWTASENAVKYDIYNGSNYVGSTSDTSFSVHNLTSGSIYTFKIFAVNADGITSASTNINVETLIDADEIPEWNSNTIYLKGDQAICNGNVYMAQWWTRGIIPGSTQAGSSVWIYVGKAGSKNLKITIEADKEGAIPKGTLTKFTASVYGEQNIISYQYYIVKDGIVFYKNNAALNASFEYTLQEQGDYQILAYCRDESGNTASNKMIVSVA